MRRSPRAYTVKAVSGQAHYIATLTEPAPIRIWWDFAGIVDMLYWNLNQSILDAIEYQTISADGTGKNQTGILNTSGVTVQHYNTDLPTTLRSAVTKMQTLGEQPNGWALNPADAQAINLLRWQTDGGFPSGGYENDPGARYGTRANIFGSNDIQRIVTPHVPPGVAILGDFNQLQLFIRHAVCIDVATQGAPGAADLFSYNQFQLRCEIPVGVGVLRPQAYCTTCIKPG